MTLNTMFGVVIQYRYPGGELRIATPFFSQIVISIIFDNESSPDTWLGVYLKTNIKRHAFNI